MHGLAIFQHDVVGDVDNVIDRAYTGGAQALPHPLGGGGDLDVFHHAGGVAGAECGIFDLHIQILHDAAAAALHLGGVQCQRLLEGCGGLPGQTDHGQAVRAVGGDLKLHHMVVHADDGLDVVAGGDVLFVQNENAVGNAVGELLLLGVQVGQRADGAVGGVQSHHIALMQVLQVGGQRGSAVAGVRGDGEGGITDGLHTGDLSGDHLAEDLVAGLDVGGDAGVLLVDGVIVAQNGGGLDHTIGEVVLIQSKLRHTAQHTVRGLAAQLALGDLDAAGKSGLMLGHGHQIAHMDIPGAGADLYGLIAYVDLAHPHVVGVGVALHLRHAAHDHVGDLVSQLLEGLHLGAGNGHGLGEGLVVNVIDADIGNELVQPVTGKNHYVSASFDQNCSRNRTSFSKQSFRLLMP